MKKQEAEGLLSNLGIKTLLSKTSLLSFGFDCVAYKNERHN